MADTARWLSEVRRVLVPRGRLLLTTPSHGRLRLLARRDRALTRSRWATICTCTRRAHCGRCCATSASVTSRCAGAAGLPLARRLLLARRGALTVRVAHRRHLCAARAPLGNRACTSIAWSRRSGRSRMTPCTPWPTSAGTRRAGAGSERRQRAGGSALDAVELPRRARAAGADLIHHPLPAHAYAPGTPRRSITVHDLAFELAAGRLLARLPPLRARRPPPRRAPAPPPSCA